MTPKTRKNTASVGKTNEVSEPQTTHTEAELEGLPLENSTRHEKIRRRAYEIYVERGEGPGRELDDWLQAEREIEGGLP